MANKKEISLRGKQVVIIGNGIAGNSAASAVRKFDPTANIVMISDEKDPLYSPCAFYKFLAGEMEQQKLFLKAFKNYSEEGIKTIFSEKVSGVDSKAKEVCLGDKRILYHELILATGSDALILPVEGTDKRGVFTLKKMDDVKAIFLYPAKRTVIIGSGAIGIEAAVALRKRGVEVTVVEILDRILPRLFDETAAIILERIIESHGIKVLTGERVIGILGKEGVRGLTTNKRELSCEMVVMTSGVRPNVGLAEQMGLEIGGLGGIVTDNHMVTSIEDVYACGDCIESKDVISGERTLSLLWPNAKRQGWIAGCNCAGEQKMFTGSLNLTNIEIFGIYATSAGIGSTGVSNEHGYEIVERTSGSSFCRLIMKDRRLMGMQLIGKGEYAGRLLSKMVRKDDLMELAKEALNDKVISMRPWNYWINRYHLLDKTSVST